MPIKDDLVGLADIHDDYLIMVGKMDSIITTIKEHTKQIREFDKTLFNNGLSSSVAELHEKFDKQMLFCSQIQEERQEKKIERLKQKIDEQKVIIESGGNRRTSMWLKMKWWQKLATFSGFAVILFPYVKILIINIFALAGIKIEFPGP